MLRRVCDTAAVREQANRTLRKSAVRGQKANRQNPDTAPIPETPHPTLRPC